MRAIRKGFGILLAVVIATSLLAGLVVFLRHHNLAVLQPAGTVSHQERNLIFLALGLCAIVVIPVFTLAIFIATKYREGNAHPKKYSPDWDGDRRLELAWWAVPFIIISILGVVTWNSSYNLDPYKALAATSKPLTIQVVALDWKWLFIYPEQNIASVNHVNLPLDTPVEFDITSQSVMNSFWIPNLGGQIYAMPGMSTKLHLLATRAGEFPGRSANISGRGFAGMQFIAQTSSNQEFDSWVNSAKTSAQKLTNTVYVELSRPSQNNPVNYYSGVQPGLYNQIVNQYAGPYGRMHMEGM